jgi:hypothetical protein
MRTWRRLDSFVGHGFFTCLVAFSFQTRQVMQLHGCTFTASRIGIRLDSIVGALQCCLSCTVSCARCAGALHPQALLVVAHFYCSCGCGLVYRLVVHWFFLVDPLLLTFGISSVYLMKGNLELTLSIPMRWIRSLLVVYVFEPYLCPLFT